MKKHRLYELDILRGLMALWVVYTHCVPSSVSQLPPPWNIVAKGDMAVLVFIILSGFVISMLLDTKHEPYRVFITRRFFRLYPVYIVMLLVSCLTFLYLEGENYRLLQQFPNPDPVRFNEHYARYLYTRAQFGWHLLAHLFMLHGAVPASVLPGSSNAILVPAWSISLEFQFYLLAPIIWTILTRLLGPNRKLWWLAGLGVVSTVLAFVVTSRGSFETAFILGGLPYFFIGIFSYLFFRTQINRTGATVGKLWSALAVFFALVIVFAAFTNRGHSLVGGIWLFTLSYMMRRTSSGSEGPAENNVLVRLGRISYSLYLCHWPILVISAYTILGIFAVHYERLESVILFLLVPPLSIACASLLYRWIEHPGIEYGARLAKSLNQAKTGK